MWYGRGYLICCDDGNKFIIKRCDESINGIINWYKNNLWWYLGW